MSRRSTKPNRSAFPMTAQLASGSAVVESKQCLRCHDRLQLREFRPDPRAVSGLDWICAQCRDYPVAGGVKA